MTVSLNCFFCSFKMYFPKHAWQDCALLFLHDIRCILLANLELNTAQITEIAHPPKELHVYFQHTISTQTLSHLTWWLCVHHRWRWRHCVVIGGGWWSKRICSWCSCLFCKWLKLSTQDNDHFALKLMLSMCKRILMSFLPTYEIL